VSAFNFNILKQNNPRLAKNHNLNYNFSIILAIARAFVKGANFMKNFWKFCLFFACISFFVLFTIFITESADVLKIRDSKISVTFKNDGENLIMSWTPLPYPCTYKIETFSQTTGILKNEEL
jgi:hypothetical protein